MVQTRSFCSIKCFDRINVDLFTNPLTPKERRVQLVVSSLVLYFIRCDTVSCDFVVVLSAKSRL